ncbi:glycosyl transferase [Chytriomyces sp. MP71]|nr:glycosyl transferase [Chytriomyces sp. MP71]
MDLGQHADEASGTVATDASLCTAHGWRPRDHQNSGRRVIDVVLFSVELDLLELRIRELLPVVDVFVIAEAPNTFTGLPKPMVFDLNQDRFAFAAHKIQYVPLPGRELAVGEDPFNIEAENRNNVSKYLRTSELLQLREGELLIMSDVDEIPSREAIQLVRSCDGVPPNLHLR